MRRRLRTLVGFTILSSHRDKEWLKPKLIVARSLGSSPSSKDANCSRIPRNKSLFPRLSGFDTDCTLILSFLDIECAVEEDSEQPSCEEKNLRGFQYEGTLPSLLSATMRDCFPLPFSKISSDKNFFRPLPIFPSWIAVISSTAVAVDVNRCKARSFNLLTKIEFRTH